MTADRGRRLIRSPLGVRLVAGFVVVAVAAVFVLAGLTLWRTKHTVGRLADERQQATADAIAQTLGLAYQQSGSWADTDSRSASMLASQAGAGLTVLDLDGQNLELQDPMGNMAQRMAGTNGIERRSAIVVDGHQVGTVLVTFTRGQLPQAELHVRDALQGTVLIGAVAAAAVALAVAIPLTRRVIRPLARVTDAARRLGDGDITARVGGHDAPGELGTLATTFDAMADRIEAHESTRRNVVADIAHELRTPLTLLQGNCEEIIDGITEPSLERFVQMHDDVLRLRRLVDDLGTLADADSAATEPTLRHERCDLADIAAQVADSMGPSIEAHQHQLQRHLEPVTVDGDPVRLTQIVTNLLTNAIKFTPPGGHIALDVRPDPDRTQANLTVTDDGPGITPADRPHVFERFYRGDRTRAVAGTGIGLAVVDQLVRAHRGNVEVAGTDGGTKVIVTFPTAARDPEASPRRQSAHSAENRGV